jgi:hypothetical protein
MGLNHGWRGPNIVRDGLVLYLDAGSPNSYQGSGTTWKDISKFYQNNGTLVNGPTFSSGNGGSIVFDGVNDYVNCGNGSSINIVNNVSVNIWFKINSFGGYQGIIAKRNFSTGFTNYGINFNNSIDALSVYFNTDGGSNFKFASTTMTNNFTTNIWYNVCGVFEKSSSNTNIYIYKNGILLTSNTVSGNLATVSTPLTLGSSAINAELFNGNIAVGQIYNRALSASEVQQNYNATKGRFGL